jgi:hypothetical protein
MLGAAIVLSQLAESESWDYEGDTVLAPQSPTDILELESIESSCKELGKNLGAGLTDTESDCGILLADILRSSNKKIEGGKIVKSGKTGGLERNYLFAALVNYFTGTRTSNSYVPRLDSVTNDKYPAFGGVDQGYVSKKRTKSDE